MRKAILSIMLLAGIFTAMAPAVAGRTSFGAGLGVLYNGLGINFGLRGETDFKYLALGCAAIGYSSRYGTSSDCGMGTGWMNSAILSDMGRHALGVHLGLTYDTHEDRDEIEAFVGIPYVYFFNGIDTAGLNLGLAPYLGRHNGENRGGFLLNLGYQF